MTARVSAHIDESAAQHLGVGDVGRVDVGVHYDVLDLVQLLLRTLGKVAGHV